MSSNMWKDKKTYAALLAEFLGTLLLVFIGCGSGTNWGDGSGSIIQISLAVGFTLASIVQTIGHVSGGHVNPSVTVAMMVTQKINPILGFLYILAQCGGALVGSTLLKSVLPEEVRGNLGATVPHPSLSALQACGVEFLATFVLVFTIFGVCDKKRDDVKGSAPLAIGFSASACCLVAIKLTGSSLNPARSLAPAILSSTWTLHWVYWVGPCLGGVFAGLIYQFVFRAQGQRPTPKRQDSRDYEMCAKGDQ
ncbi:aquaporin AQPAe.a [Folsomia candida]|uniref:Aquaporin AQPAe.a n=1 Tax=Folsomia candida TaxID=158441 RepID=A0A226F322_FOLCA|nr:aquaporin AQPAe.a [Folsomia candida]OXA63750.1 Aquaporin AQPAe.a [Folsomia candida]